MLKIRAAQMQAFQAAADKAFARKLAVYLREKHAGANVRLPTGAFLLFELSSATLETIIHTGLARARRYSFISEADLAGFVILMVETAPNFDDHPLLQRGLRDERVKLEERIKSLLQNATDANWQAVREEYNPQAWLGGAVN